MEKSNVIRLINNSPVFYLATIDEESPRVRGMLLYNADETGLIFHTASFKDLYSQIKKNSNAEACFNCEGGVQIRVSGEIEEISDKSLKDSIMLHPSRQFLRDWKYEGKFTDVYSELIVFKLKYNKANIWSIDKNFQPNQIINMK